MEEIKTESTVAVKTSGLAIASLVLGILGFVCIPVIPSLLALIFGIISLKNIGKSAGTLGGKGLAIAGTILGGIGTFLTLIATIAIIAAIAIPNLLTSRISVNETIAISGLRTLVSVETIWRQMDTDENGEQDYWTYDVSCFYRMYRPNTTTKAEMIDISLAKADANPARDNAFASGKIEPWSETVPTPIPKAGYLYQALKYDEEGIPYHQNLVDEVPATNDYKFGFIAVPTVYGTNGVRIFIVNEAGTIYATDPGSDENKWIEQWPGPDPTTVVGPGGKNWQVVE